MIKLVRETETILGKDKKILSPDEKSNSMAVRKSCVSKRDISKGEIIKIGDICFKRPGTGVSPFSISKIINKKAKRIIRKDKIIKKEDFY